MFCPNCHKEVDKDVNFCKYCGFKFRKFEENLSQDKNWNLHLFIGVTCIVLFIVMALFAISNDSRSKTQDFVAEQTRVENTEVKDIKPAQTQTSTSTSSQVKTTQNTGSPSLSKVSLISKGFGYTQFGEPAVVGQVKNNNNQAVYIRADIDLLDSYGNIVGDTYTYQNVQPHSVWNFEAPTFGITASNMDVHLSIDE